jgi:putative colanic acid biosynthesis UDP-glucose lipid carrier transferase
MDKFSIPNNFSPSFQDISTAEVQFTYEDIYLNQGRVTRHPLENNRNLIIKRSFDILVSSFLIVFILSWLIPLLAILIKLDSRGPVFFFQKRNKNGGGIFTCIKFRSMIVNKDADTLVACENDKRITRFGKFLRNNHIDELPQLFNVMAGDMSIIGHT